MNSIKNISYQLKVLASMTLNYVSFLVMIYFCFKQNISTGDFVLLLIGILLNLVFIILVIRKLMIIPEILLSNNGISIESKKNKRLINWSEITDIDFYGRNGAFRMETIKIKTKLSRKPFLIYYSHYSNSSIIAQAISFLYESIKNNENSNLASFVPLTIASVEANKFRFENFQYISRIPLVSFRSYFPLMGAILIYILVTDVNGHEGLVVKGIVISIYMSAFLTFFIGFSGMTKIGISNEFLRIENYYFSYGKTYRLKDIKEVYIECTSGKAPNSLRLILRDNTSKAFFAANFLKRDWIDLGNKLYDKKIKVTNNLYKTTRNKA